VTFPNPDTAWIALIIGLLGVYFEFCKPGWVIPGVAGGVLATLGTASLVRMYPPFEGIHVVTALGTSVPFAIITVFLLSTAIRARRNKRSTATQTH